mmetsp:Transcript_20714/g.33857  ORF Transcript_20714/g.33857 Transcript_20714/m.33857 type:complete len:486 (+) Transcript_20714:37-1494(+)
MPSVTGLLLLSFFCTTRVTSLCTTNLSTSRPIHPDHDVIIVGGSICGLATAVALKTQLSPINAQIYERATSLKKNGALLSLFPNGMTALQNILGDLHTSRDPKRTLWDILNQQSVPLQQTIIKEVLTGQVTDERVVKSVDKTNEGKSPGRFILWYQLQSILLEALKAAPLADENENCMSLGCEFQSYSFDNSTGLIRATFKATTDTGEINVEKTCRLLIGADGIRSTLRPLISRSGPTPQIRSYKRIIFRSLVDATGIAPEFIPSTGTAVVYKSVTNVGQIFKLQPCSEAKTIALTATASTEDTEEVVRQWQSNEAISNWKKMFSDFPRNVLDLIDLCPSVFTNCVSDLQIDDKVASPTLCWSNGDEPVVLVGDAVHGMTPSLGQGANVCMEDAIELAMILKHTCESETADASIRDLTPAQVMRTITLLQATRNERVVGIHRSSRNQASMKLSGDSSLKSYQEENEIFFRRLYEWTPKSNADKQN